jgi:hypothetical protein
VHRVNGSDLGALGATFRRDAFADVTAAIPADARARVALEACAALDEYAVRRDVCVPATGASPRKNRIAGRDALLHACPATAAYYRSAALLGVIAEIAGEALIPVPYAPEELIATRLERAGDTHGWHWDDYGFALVWVLRAPPPHDGGVLEYLAGETWCKSAPRIDAILAAREPVRAHLPAGSVYLLRTDTTLHRVTPLLRDVRRDALVFSYAAVRDAGRTVTHETLDAILATEGMPA